MAVGLGTDGLASFYTQATTFLFRVYLERGGRWQIVNAQDTVVLEKQ
jgi:hypothetical protein